MKNWDLIGLTFGTIVVIFYIYDKYFKNKKRKISYIKYGISKEQFERLTDYEQERKPNLKRDKAEKWALDRIERDNR